MMASVKKPDGTESRPRTELRSQLSDTDSALVRRTVGSTMEMTHDTNVTKAANSCILRPCVKTAIVA